MAEISKIDATKKQVKNALNLGDKNWVIKKKLLWWKGMRKLSNISSNFLRSFKRFVVLFIKF